ncbi:MAG: tetratricopeptide repeat protein [Bryobacteraceae bacterium]
MPRELLSTLLFLWVGAISSLAQTPVGPPSPPPQTPSQAIETGQKLFEQRRYLEAERLFQESLGMLAPDDPRRPGTLRMVGAAMRLQGRFADAAAPLNERLKLEPDSESAIEDLAVAYMGSGEPAKALALYEQLVALKQKQLEERQGPTKRGVDEMPLIPALQKLARAQEFALQPKVALVTLNRIMTIRSKSQGSDHIDLAPEFLNLGRLYLALKNDEMAAASFQFALEILEKTYGLEDSRLLPAIDRLAQSWRNLKRADDAEMLYRRALALREATYGGLHPDIAQTLDALGKMLFDQKRYSEAEPLYRRSLGIWALGLGPRHVLLALSLDNLAVTVAALGKFDEADQLYKQALAIRDFDDVGSLRNLAVIAQARAKPKEVETYLRRALSTIDASPEKSDALTPVLKDLAEALRKQNKNVEAAKLDQRRQELKKVTPAEQK